MWHPKRRRGGVLANSEKCVRGRDTTPHEQADTTPEIRRISLHVAILCVSKIRHVARNELLARKSRATPLQALLCSARKSIPCRDVLGCGSFTRSLDCTEGQESDRGLEHDPANRWNGPERSPFATRPWRASPFRAGKILVWSCDSLEPRLGAHLEVALPKLFFI